MRFLILGLDEGFNRRKPGYTDTIILASMYSPKRKLVMMSIPRDLWIPTSGREESRIGVVYTAAETKVTGKGLSAITAVVSKNFQIPVHYYVLVKMQGFMSIVDSLGGVDIVLLRPTAGYPMGVTHLDGRAALAFARDRAETDDFARMIQAQILIKGIIAQAFKVETWSKLLHVSKVLREATESNIPFWEWPRFAYVILHSYFNGIESYTITRDMVDPKITSQGEQVIEPDWDKIRALTLKIFDK
jgi:polyisoprenyl-teichoic acid--peptidoglycan teichoic acid transferase